MKFVEFTSKHYNRDSGQYEVGDKFMMDMSSQWEIHDNGDKPATWVNMNLGMNKDVNDTYAEIKAKFIAAGLLLDLDNIVPETSTKINGQSFEDLYDQFLRQLPGKLAQDYVEQDHHPVALAFKAVLKIIADNGIKPQISVRRADLHKALMYSDFGLSHGNVKKILDLLMPIIEK